MFNLKLAKRKTDPEYLFKFSGECLGRQIEFGLSNHEIERLKDKSRSFVADLTKWKNRAKLLAKHEGTKQNDTDKGPTKKESKKRQMESATAI